MDIIVSISFLLFLSIIISAKVLVRFSVGISFISPSALKLRMDKRDNLLVIDVRTPEEFITNHITGALNLPLNNLYNRLRELQNQLIFCNTTPIFLVCQSGKRAFSAAKSLRKIGFVNVNVVAGGMIRWISNGLPTKHS